MRLWPSACSVLALAVTWVGTASATESLRVATFNMLSINLGTSAYTALLNTLARIDADVVFLQEVEGAPEAAQVATLATAAGYPFFRVGNVSGTLSGDLRNAVLSRHPISASTSWSAKVISGDNSANDITRDILQVVLAVPEVCDPVGVFTVHLKAGSTSTDDFRRAVELLRLKQVVQSFLTQNPTGRVIIGGDFNDDLGDGPFGFTFNSLPSGLPQTYQLGNDISFPVVYDPFLTVASIGGQAFSAVDAQQEDSSNDFTRIASQRRLDYLFRPFNMLTLGDEVYYSQLDNGVDDGTIGSFLYKSGAPLSSSTSSTASDHLPVFGDFLLESCDGTRYGFGYPGSHNLVPRAGIRGGAHVNSPGFGFRLRYGAPNQTGVLVFGSQKLSPPLGFSLTPFVPGAFLHVSVAGSYGLFAVATNAQGDAEFPLALPNQPTLAGLTFDTQWFVNDPAGPNGVGAMSDAYEVVIAP